MENILIKYISKSAQENLINNTIIKLQILKKESNNFNELFKGQKIFLNSKTIEPFYDFIHAYSEIYNMVDKDNFLGEAEQTMSDNEIDFWNSVFRYFDQVKVAREETKFLRELDIDSFKDLVLHTFNMNILHEGFTRNYKEWNKEKIKIVQRTIRTFLSSILDDFNDYETVIYFLDIKFKFNKEKYSFIWELCEQNKTYLMLKNITETLNYLYYYSEKD